MTVWETASGHLFGKTGDKRRETRVLHSHGSGLRSLVFRTMKGASQVEFLAVLLIFCIGMAIAWPHLSLSRNATAEAKAVNALKQVHEAQKDFYAGRRYFGSEQQLKAFGALTGIDLTPENNMAAVGVETRITYSIDIQVGGGRTRWCAGAIPNPSGRNIAIDETGKVQMDKTCYDGVVQ